MEGLIRMAEVKEPTITKDWEIIGQKDISNQKIRQAINTNKCPTCGAILHSLNPLFNHGRHGGLECGNCR